GGRAGRAVGRGPLPPRPRRARRPARPGRRPVRRLPPARLPPGLTPPVRPALEAPVTDTLANRLSALSADRRALFEALTGRANGTRGTTPDGLAPRPAGAPAEVSHAQRRLWFMDQLRPHDPVYNVPIATRIRGPLDVPALHEALQTVVDRHEVLRTVYRGDGHEPEPVVLDGHRVPLPVVELPDEDALRPFLEE